MIEGYCEILAILCHKSICQWIDPFKTLLTVTWFFPEYFNWNIWIIKPAVQQEGHSWDDIMNSTVVGN